MKPKILFLIAMLAVFPVQADFILKYGMVASDHQEDNTLTWAGLWGETNNCDYCVALFAVETYRKNETPRDRLLGVDYVIKSFETDSGVIRTNLGFAVADEGLQGGETFNFHFGLSMTAKKCIAGYFSCSLNYDHFSNGKIGRAHV